VSGAVHIIKSLCSNSVSNGTYNAPNSFSASSCLIICTAPLTKETQNKFNATAFKKMKNDAIFINIGRGAVVDEQALIAKCCSIKFILSFLCEWCCTYYKIAMF
jgi:lactate dehydrogenase-like 2-hydroxyacid dehydrogenase